MSYERNKKRYSCRNSDENTFRRNDSQNFQGYRRPILHSSEDVDRMAIESARARLIMRDAPEELKNQFNNLHKNRDVSAKTSVPNELIKQVYSTYPTLVQGLHWSNPIETYSEDLQTGSEDSLCKRPRCRINDEQKNKQEDKVKYVKENIVQYSDNSTMTRNLVDKGCGVRTPLSRTTKTSEVSISTDDNRNASNPLKYPVRVTPILKDSCNSKCGQKSMATQNYNDKNLLKLHTPTDAVPLKEIYSNNGYENARKVLYNEGISDDVTQKAIPNVSVPPKRIMSQVKFKNFVRSQKTYKDVDKQSIPHNHMHSKYHLNCREESHHKKLKFNYCVTSPLFLSSYVKNSVKHGATSIKLPRKVLTSERDIDAFMDKRQR